MNNSEMARMVVLNMKMRWSITYVTRNVDLKHLIVIIWMLAGGFHGILLVKCRVVAH